MPLLTNHGRIVGWQTRKPRGRKRTVYHLSMWLHRLSERGCPGGPECRLRHDADHLRYLADTR